MEEEFAEALCHFVRRALNGQDGVYIQGAARILDARNHLFALLPHQATDEGADIYALADLCHLNDDMETEPDIYRALAIARHYFS